MSILSSVLSHLFSHRPHFGNNLVLIVLISVPIVLLSVLIVLILVLTVLMILLLNVLPFPHCSYCSPHRLNFHTLFFVLNVLFRPHCSPCCLSSSWRHSFSFDCLNAFDCLPLCIPKLYGTLCYLQRGCTQVHTDLGDLDILQ